jgi:hypothetical protein
MYTKKIIETFFLTYRWQWWVITIKFRGIVKLDEQETLFSLLLGTSKNARALHRDK